MPLNNDMKHKPFNFEFYDLLLQFGAALDEIKINRYDDDIRKGLAKGEIVVPIVFAQKNRVIHDIVNKEKGRNLPIISYSYGSVKYNPQRSKNKQMEFYLPSATEGARTLYKNIVPVDISVKVNILTKYRIDLDQIIQNITTACTPYFVIEWQIPSTTGVGGSIPIRNAVLWDGNFSVDDSAADLGEDKKQLITAETTFTIEGWLFREQASGGAPIRTINMEYSPTKTLNVSDEEMDELIFDELVVSGVPIIEKVLVNGVVVTSQATSLDPQSELILTLRGNGVEYADAAYITTDTTGITHDTIKDFQQPGFPNFSGLSVPFVHTDTGVQIVIPTTLKNIAITGNFYFTLANKSGYSTTRGNNGKIFNFGN